MKTDNGGTDAGLLIPVILGSVEDAAADDVTLPLPSAETGGHPFGCLCCLPRGLLGRELGRLFSARARGEVAFFRRVVLLGPAAAAPDVARQIAADVVAGARFRFAGAC